MYVKIIVEGDNMTSKNIDLMIKGELEHSNIFLAEEVSYSDASSSYGYGEYNGVIIDAINDMASDGPFALICDNVIKFIDHKQSKMENEHYKSIIQKEFHFKFSFSYNIIYRAYKDKDIELLDFEFNRIGSDLDKLLLNPFSMFNEDEKGIAFALMMYISESINIYDNVYKNNKENLIEQYRTKLNKLNKIYNLK